MLLGGPFLFFSTGLHCFIKRKKHLTTVDICFNTHVSLHQILCTKHQVYIRANDGLFCLLCIRGLSKWEEGFEG